MFDTADVYSGGASEEILGAAIKGRRNQAADLHQGHVPLQRRTQRRRLVPLPPPRRPSNEQLRRLGTDHIDLFQLHGFDALTPPEEVLATLDDLVRAGKILYVGVLELLRLAPDESRSLSPTSMGYPRYVANQTYYSLIGRDYEWELMPLGLDQGIGAVVWSPLGWGRLTGKIRRGQPLPKTSRLHATVGLWPAGRGRVSLPRRRCPGRDRQGDRQDHPADRPQLAAAAPDRLDGRHRRQERAAAQGQPRRRRLEPDARAGEEARRRERRRRWPIPTGTSAALRSAIHWRYNGSPAPQLLGRTERLRRTSCRYGLANLGRRPHSV